MNMTQCKDFEALMGEVVTFLAVADKEQRTCYDAARITGIDVTVFMVADSHGTTASFHVLHPDGWWSEFQANYSGAATEGYCDHVFEGIRANLILHVFEEDSASQGARKVEETTKLGLVAFINDYLEGLDESQRRFKTVFRVKDLGLHAYVSYDPDEQHMLVCGLKPEERTTFGSFVMEDLDVMTPTKLALKLVSYLEEDLG